MPLKNYDGPTCEVTFYEGQQPIKIAKLLGQTDREAILAFFQTIFRGYAEISIIEDAMVIIHKAELPHSLMEERIDEYENLVDNPNLRTIIVDPSTIIRDVKL